LFFFPTQRDPGCRVAGKPIRVHRAGGANRKADANVLVTSAVMNVAHVDRDRRNAACLQGMRSLRLRALAQSMRI